MTDSLDVVIGIGRGRPQDDNYIADVTRWHAFRGDVHGIAREWGTVNATNHGETFSQGWGTEQGFWVAATIPADTLPTLRSALRHLATYWRQDAVALTVGATELVSA